MIQQHERRLVTRQIFQADGFEPVAIYPNDLLPPKVMGLWVDRDNLVSNPLLEKGPKRLFVLDGLQGQIARAALRWAPWLVCGEVVFIARAR